MNKNTPPLHILVSWIGMTDIKASSGDESVGVGPLAQALIKRKYDHVILISDQSKKIVQPFTKWLQEKTTASLAVEPVKLSSPMHFGEIYEIVTRVISTALTRHGEETRLTYHLSPGTPAMAAVWIIVAKTRYAAELLESSREHGVKTATIPFDIAAEFVPDLLKRPDSEITKLAAGLTETAPAFDAIIHRSPEMKRVIARAQKVAPRSVPVLIEGDSGTGKEMLANAIHAASLRHDKPFVVVNCGAIPSELIESELFGHKKGTFTGATSNRTGLFKAADGGTIFLDEIGELPLKMQVKLLRVLQEKKIKPIGEEKEIAVDFRLITATNRNLAVEVAENNFREDLFYRLAVAVINLPPLRARTGDLGLLIDYLMKEINIKSASEPDWKEKNISVKGKKLLLNHAWPGNIRELQNTLTRATVWTSGPTLTENDIRDALLKLPGKESDSDNILNKDIDQGLDLQSLTDEISRHYINRALKLTGGRLVQAAQLLGISNYQTLKNKMKKLDINP